jgi:hypothetical protein
MLARSLPLQFVPASYYPANAVLIVDLAVSLC